MKTHTDLMGVQVAGNEGSIFASTGLPLQDFRECPQNEGHVMPFGLSPEFCICSALSVLEMT